MDNSNSNPITGGITIGQNSSFSNDGWVDMNTYEHGSMPDYSNFAAYMSPVTHCISPDGLTRMQPLQSAPQLQSQHQLAGNHHQQQQHHHQLPMLIMPPHAAWPSMLTNPSPGYAMSPMTHMPTPTAPPKSARLGGGSHPQPRRTLTDNDRRRMCQYHEDNPNVKQTEIGAMFGVERSTVSKVLRNKEKYLYSGEDRCSSPIKRVKGKFPDIERALSSWARKAQQSGADLSDSEIWEKARHFAQGIGGSSSDSHVKSLSSSWLEKFKQKNGIGRGRLIRRASETHLDRAKMSAVSPSMPTLAGLGPLQSSAILSPSSPDGPPSPVSATRSEDGIDGIHGGGVRLPMNFGPGNNKRTVSHSSALTDSFSADPLSPEGPFTFSPDPNTNANNFISPADRALAEEMGPNFHRPRSQTFPTLDLEFLNQSSTDAEASASNGVVSSNGSNNSSSSSNNETVKVESEFLPQSPEAQTTPSFAIDPAIQASSSPRGARRLRHSASHGTLGSSRPLASPLAISALPLGSNDSAPGSPTQEDARRAADTLLNFIQSLGSGVQMFDQNDYMTVVRLTEKLRIHGQSPLSQGLKTPSTPGLSLSMGGLGGLSRIPEGDSEISSLTVAPMKTEVTMAG